MVDIFQGRTVLLLLSELSGPGLESCAFATSDSCGLLVLFWDLSDTVYTVPDSCALYWERALLGRSSGILLFCSAAAILCFGAEPALCLPCWSPLLPVVMVIVLQSLPFRYSGPLLRHGR